MKPLFEILPDLLRKQPQKHLPLEEMVRAAWAHLVGRQIASRSHVFRLYRETLIVHVPDRTWQKQLHRMERRLLVRVNQMLGRSEITRMDFHVDPALAVARGSPENAAGGSGNASITPPRKGPAREGAPAAEAELEDSARPIADPELRDLFLRASRKMMK